VRTSERPSARAAAVAVLFAVAACARHAPAPIAPIPAAAAGEVRASAVAGEAVGSVQPIAIALTNGRATAVRLDVRQVYAHGDGDERTAPLPPPEAARLAGGHRMSGALRGGATGAATGTVLGAIGGAISGAITGGIGLAVAAGSAVGAFFGAIGGALGGGTTAPDVAGFEDRALPDATLAPGFSASGCVYYPLGAYRSVELLLTDDAGRVERLEVPIAER
jgi:hypothetical protein